MKVYMERMKTASSTETLMEKEYHFDEGVGVSLDMHIKDLKKKYPAAKVQSRRDRDGFAVIKISNKPNYKYNLENILKIYLLRNTYKTNQKCLYD